MKVRSDHNALLPVLANQTHARLSNAVFFSEVCRSLFGSLTPLRRSLYHYTRRYLIPPRWNCVIRVACFETMKYYLHSDVCLRTGLMVDNCHAAARRFAIFSVI